MTLARTGLAEQECVFALGNEPRGGELEDEGAVDLLVEGEVEAVERAVGVAKARLLVSPGEQPVLAALELVGDERREQVERAAPSARSGPGAGACRGRRPFRRVASLRSAWSSSTRFMSGLLFCGCSTSTTFAARVASFRNVTHRPQKDRTASPARIGGNVPAHHRVSCPVHAGARHAGDLVDHHGAARNRRSPSPSRHRTPVTEPQRHSPRSATGGAGGRAAGEAMPFPRQRSVVGR